MTHSSELAAGTKIFLYPFVQHHGFVNIIIICIYQYYMSSSTILNEKVKNSVTYS